MFALWNDGKLSLNTVIRDISCVVHEHLIATFTDPCVIRQIVTCYKTWLSDSTMCYNRMVDFSVLNLINL